jgi:glycosyltransferase involved in cell wall biosynthesis
MVAHAYPRWPGDVAGSFIARTAETLVTQGHTISVVVPADQGNAERRSVNGVTVIPVRYASPERENLAYVGDMAQKVKSLSGLRAFWSLIRALGAGAREESRRINGDLLHAWWWIPGGWAAVRTGLPTVISLLGTDVALLKGLPARLLGRSVLGRARRVTAISTYLADAARRRTFRHGLAIDLIPVPADVSRFTRASRGGGGIAYLGRLTDQKRVDLLLTAVAHSGLNVPVTIVGDGPARPGLEDLARRLGLGTIRFLGALPNEELPAAIGDADVSAFLARQEGLGLAAAEAQMLGIPVVATTDGGGVLDLVEDGVGGWVVPPTPEAVGKALRTLIGNATARERAQRAGDALRERLNPDSIARAFAAVYASL